MPPPLMEPPLSNDNVLAFAGETGPTAMLPELTSPTSRSVPVNKSTSASLSDNVPAAPT